MPSKREGWAGCMTLARELSESNGKLLQRPVHEAESLRQQHQSISPRTISNKYVLQKNAQAVEIQLQWALKNSDAEHYGLQLGTECGCILITNLSGLFCGGITHTSI